MQTALPTANRLAESMIVDFTELTLEQHDPDSDKNKEVREYHQDPTLPVRNQHGNAMNEGVCDMANQLGPGT